jgi:plasmid maintenance system antidote protein VapI
MATNLNMTVAATVRALARGRGLRTVDVQEAIGVSHGTINNRLNAKTPWTAEEVDTLARLFDVTVRDLLTGLDGTFS